MAEQKAEILQFLRNADASSRFAPPPIHRASRNETIALSFAQERLWFLRQLEPGSAVYNICRAARLTGPLDVRTLESSINEIVRRHEILRTHFGVMNGDLRQRVQPLQPLDLPVIEMGRSPSAQPELQTIVSEEARRPFQLDRDLRLRTGRESVDADLSDIRSSLHIIADAYNLRMPY